MFKKTYLFILLSMVVLLTACSSKGKSSESVVSDDTKITTNTETNSVTTETKAPDTRTITHAMGETEITGTPKRIVILTNEGTEALLSLGITPVGAVQSWLGDPWYDHITEYMTDVQNVGTESEVNIEAIAALKPDLIIGNKVRQEAIYDQLSMIAPTIFSEALNGTWQDNFSFYADTLNLSTEGDALLAKFDARIAEISALAGDNLSKEISVIRFIAGSTRIYQLDSFSGIILNQIGFARPESQNISGFAEAIGKERLTEADGDIIFYFTYETGDGEANNQEKDWLNDPLFQALEASKNNKVYKVSDPIWNTSGGILAASLMLDDLSDFITNELK